MKICMAGLGIGKTHGAFVGGHVNNVVNLSKKLAEDGYQVHIVTTPPIHSNSTFHNPEMAQIHPNVFFHEVKVKGDYINANLNYSIRSIAKILLEIRKLHREEKFDVIHGHSGFSLIALIPEIAGIFSGVFSMHTLNSPLNEKVVSREVSKYCMRKLDLITVLSENTKKSLRGIIPENRIRIIPPLIDTSRFSSHITDSIGGTNSEEENPTLLFIGNLTKTKGIGILVKALKIVKEDVPDVKLLMGIDIPLKKFLIKDYKIKHQIKELGLDQNVIPLGIIKDLPEVMARSDIFVAPFINTYGPADYPLSTLEAMASGLPVVATNVGGIPEIVKHRENGLLVEPNNSFELAESISYLLENEKERRRMGDNGAKLAMNLNKNVVKEIKSIYEHVAGG